MRRDTRILFLLPSLKRGGAERVAHVLATHLSRDYNVQFALYDTTDQAYQTDLVIHNLRSPATTSLLRKPGLLITRVVRLMRLLRQTTPTVVISFMESCNIPAACACLLLRMQGRLVVTVHNNPRVFPAIHRALMSLLYRIPGAVVPVSEGIAKVLRQDLRLCRGRVHAIPNPIDLRSVRAAADKSPTGFTPPASYIVAVGRLVPQKGFDVLLEIYAKIAPHVSEDLVILGDGPLLSFLQRRIMELGLERRAHIPGAVDNPFPFLKKAGLFVSTSLYEGWPLALMEAMACGCPPIAFDCDFGPREIVLSGVNGLLIAPRDYKALEHAVRKVLTDHNLHSRLSTAARIDIHRFDSPAIIDRWNDMLTRVTSS